MPSIKSKGLPRTPELSDFEVFAGKFKRSQRGNLWRRYGERSLTVFHRGDGYGWCISRPDQEVEYSPTGFELEEDAVFDLWSIFEGM